MNFNRKAGCFLCAIVAGLNLNSFSQCAVSGILRDSLNAPLPFTTVALLNKADSSIYKGVISDEKGIFCFQKIKKGDFIVKVSGLGFLDYYSSSFSYDSSSAVTLPDIRPRKSGVVLQEVSVSTIKNPIEFKGGNIIVNVEDSPLAIGNSAYELISRLPGVMVDNDNISIQGKAGVQVYIDDRVLQMSGAQLSNFLRSLNASAIEKIEIINNPPARYDAAGNAGIINIRTKKVKITGFSGNLNYTFSQGFYNTNRGGFSLNYKGKKFAVFSNVGFYEGLLRSELNFKKTITTDSTTTVIDQRGHEIDAARYLIIDIGVDWYINKRNTVGIKAQGVPGNAMRTVNGIIEVSDKSLGYDQLLFNRPVGNEWYLANYNLNAEHLFDTLGTILRFSADYYGPHFDIYRGFNQNHFVTGDNGSSIASQLFRTENSLNINILAARLDFEKKFAKGLRLETGLKQSTQDIKSDYKLENKNLLTGEYTLDSNFTNEFSYSEMISAGYVTLVKEIKKLNFQLGLRAENTNIHTNSLTSNIQYSREYFNLFPVFSADYNPDQNNSMSFSYNRRINRPGYNSFNPFRSYVNVLTSSEGNPYLMPVYDNNFNFNYVYKRKISNFISYAYVQNPIQEYTSQNDITKETIFNVANVKQLNILRYNLFVRQEIKKWWTISFLAGAYYIDFNGVYNGLDYSAKAVPYYSRLTFLFLLKKEIKIEMSGFYWSPWLGGSYDFLSRGGLSWSVKKSFFDNKLSCSVGMNDVFLTEPFRSKADFQDQQWERYQNNDSRRFNVSLNYNFGKIKAEQRRTKSNDEEKNRLGK